MVTKLSQKLKAYSAAAGAITAVTGTVDAQIVHTDINPDTVLTGAEIYALDMDNNSNPEMSFQIFTYLDSLSNPIGHFAEVQLNTPTTNAIMGSLFYGYYPFPFSLNSGDSISANAGGPNWRDYNVNGGLQYLGAKIYSYSYANFLGQDKFMGVRFSISNQTHYGWVRLYVSPDADTIIVKEYAYESQPNVGITAGNLVGIPSQEQTMTRIFAYNNVLHVNRENAGAPIVVTVYNMMGEAVISEQTTDANYALDMNRYAAGIYTVNVQTGGGMVNRKIYIK
ncbi:MAG: hypothetical protein Fur0041_10290 [Bacteroidia bacterium]